MKIKEEEVRRTMQDTAAEYYSEDALRKQVGFLFDEDLNLVDIKNFHINLAKEYDEKKYTAPFDERFVVMASVGNINTMIFVEKCDPIDGGFRAFRIALCVKMIKGDPLWIKTTHVEINDTGEKPEILFKGVDILDILECENQECSKKVSKDIKSLIDKTDGWFYMNTIILLIMEVNYLIENREIKTTSQVVELEDGSCHYVKDFGKGIKAICQDEDKLNSILCKKAPSKPKTEGFHPVQRQDIIERITDKGKNVEIFSEERTKNITKKH